MLLGCKDPADVKKIKAYHDSTKHHRFDRCVGYKYCQITALQFDTVQSQRDTWKWINLYS